MDAPRHDVQAVAECARRIGDYLTANPLACDTVDGVARWWIAAAPSRVTAVSQALDWLLDHGLITRVEAADGRVRYRRAESTDPLREFSVALDDALRRDFGDLAARRH